jgi:hypothetical protein
MRLYVLITATLFGLIALAHVSRLIRPWPVNLGSYTVPLWVSWRGYWLPADFASGGYAWRGRHRVREGTDFCFITL